MFELFVFTALMMGYTRPAEAGPARLLTVTVAASSQGTRVILEGDGPLPIPAAGAVDGPPRIYLDFTDVLPGSSSVYPSEAPSIRRVRVALHSQPPLVTRVVIDLVRQAPYRIEPNSEAPNRLVITVGESERPGQRSNEPVPGSKPEVRIAKPPVPVRSSVDETGGARASGLEKPQLPNAQQTYAQQVSGLLTRLEKMRPLLVAIDTQTDQPGVSLQVAIAELDSIARALATLRPPRQMASIHDRLQQSCNLASQAVRVRMESLARGSPELGWTGASAAAGALLLLDRVRADLGLAAPRGT